MLSLHFADIDLLASRLDSVDLASSSSLDHAADFVFSARDWASFSFPCLSSAFFPGVSFALEAGWAVKLLAPSRSVDESSVTSELGNRDGGESESEKFHFLFFLFCVSC